MTSNNNDAPMPAPVLIDRVFIGLGANIPSRAGTPGQTLRGALKALAAAGLEIMAISPFYETAAWPDPKEPAYMNGVAAVRTRLQPLALMTLLHEVETAFGRTRSVANAARTLDLDLLDYGGQILEGVITLPHPRLAERRFVLEPLRDIYPAWRHPISGRNINEMLGDLSLAVP